MKTQEVQIPEANPPKKREQPAQQLQGYTLIDRLGSGGYGEVWRAQAPGGLTKAVKYVFGRQDEARATSEWKALERIKEVRHPFLLSLERIEVVDGRLIVVTELADGSLRDRYDACREGGLPGIPRDELLGYLRDAADALDFLTAEHDLQHLDIKPENLLLLAGHVKVADFGLVKSISNQAESLVGGMTPTYAAPEVFQGRPSNHSDQYSLAVLYQELLTGSLPFPGSNAAELTLQHMNDDPDLDSVDERDRFVLSRAMAKDPSYRFDSCGEMVRALAASEPGTAPPAPASSNTEPPKTWKSRTAPKSPSSATVVFEGDDPGWSDSEAPILIDLPPLEEPGVQYAPLPDADPNSFEPSPAVFIGIGGTGGRVLRALRRRLNERFPDSHSLPSLPLLLLDTDARALSEATRAADRDGGLTKEETISLQLRRPQEYRDRTPHLLRWLGRRWLYNIPRSLQTEGIRPLGRLALVDHARRTFQRVRRAISDAVGEQSVAETATVTGLSFRPDRPRVYICGSISGGAGGGMSIDVAYTVRAILKHLEIGDAQVIGVMTHSTGRDSRRGELAQVNAYSWLAEYHHFRQPGAAYPGDESCGLPPHDAGEPPLDTAYLVDLGAKLDEVAFDQMAESVADYLYLDALTPTQTVLDACREQDENRGSSLRTFAVARRASASPKLLQQIAADAIDRLVGDWIGEDEGREGPAAATPGTNPMVHGAVQLVGRLKLDSKSLSVLCRSLLEAHLSDQHTRANALPAATWQEVAAPIDALFASPGQPGDHRSGAWMLNQPVARLVQALTGKLRESLMEWLAARIEQPGERIAGARRAASWFRDHLASLRNELTQHASGASERAANWRAEQSALPWSGARADAIGAAREHLASLGLDNAATEAARTIIDGLSAATDDFVTRTGEIARELTRIRDTQRPDPQADGSDDDLSAPENITSEAAAELKKAIEGGLLDNAGGIAGVTASEAAISAFAGLLRRVADQSAQRAWDEAPTETGDAPRPTSFGCGLPSLAEEKSTVRQFAVVSAASAGSRQPAAGASGGWDEIIGPDNATSWVVEAEGLSAPRVAAELIGRRRDYAKLGERVHTRKDINWDELTEALTAPEPAPSAGPKPAVVDCTQMIDVAANATG